MNKIRIGDGLVHDGMIWTLTVIEAFRPPLITIVVLTLGRIATDFAPVEVAKSKSISET
jgi:hypothetical protein